MMRLSTSLWVHVLGFDDLRMVTRVKQTCKSLSLSLSTATNKSFALPQISLPEVDSFKYNTRAINELMNLGVRHLHCPRAYWIVHFSSFLSTLQSLHIGRIRHCDSAWYSIVKYCTRLETLVVEEVDYPPLFYLQQATFDDMPLLTHLVLPQRPFRARSDSAALLEDKRSQDVVFLFQRLSEHALLGDAYSLWCIGRLLELGTLTLEDERILKTFPEAQAESSLPKTTSTDLVVVRETVVEWFYRRSAERGYAMAQFSLYRLIKAQMDKSKNDGPIVDVKDDRVNDMLSMLKKAALQSNVFALSHMATLCRSRGEYQKMFYYWEKAAKWDEVDSMYYVSRCYLQGLGVPMDEEKGYTWLLAATMVRLDTCIPYEPGPPWTHEAKRITHVYRDVGMCKMAGIGCRRDLAGAKDCFVRWSKLCQEPPPSSSSPSSSCCYGSVSNHHPALYLLILRWAQPSRGNHDDEADDEADAYDRKDIERNLKNFKVPCPQLSYWQARFRFLQQEQERPRRVHRETVAHGSSDDDDDAVGGVEATYWTEADSADHLANAILESCFPLPNEPLILKLLTAAASSPAKVATIHTDFGDAETDDDADWPTQQASVRVRAFFMLGQAAERAGDLTLAQTWYERAASSPCRHVQARLKLDKLRVDNAAEDGDS